MNTTDKDKIEKIIEDRNKAHSFYYKKSRVYRSFVTLERKTYEDGSLEKRYKELIAIGISLHINCESCLEFSTDSVVRTLNGALATSVR